jgi:hypothetical protein
MSKRQIAIIYAQGEIQGGEGDVNAIGRFHDALCKKLEKIKM